MVYVKIKKKGLSLMDLTTEEMEVFTELKYQIISLYSLLFL